MVELIMGQVASSLIRRLIVGTIVSMLISVIKMVGGFMIKLFVMGAIIASLSALTGVPAFPVYPKIKSNSLVFEPTSIDDEKLEIFKKYVKRKFN